MSVQQQRRIRLLLVDDHPIVRTGIIACLLEQPGYEIVGEAASGKEAIEMAGTLSPDIVLMDISLPDISGLEVARLMRKSSPGTWIIALTMHDSKEYILELMRLGARGYVLKDAPPSDLTAAINQVYNGGTYFNSSHSRMLLDEFLKTSTHDRPNGSKLDDLTEREREVLTMVAQGLSNKEIATKLFLSVRTIETHRENIMRKLDIHTVAGLTRYAISVGLVTLT